MWDVLARGWDNVLARPEGPFSVRFLVQPAVAIVLGELLFTATLLAPFRMHWFGGPLLVSPY